MATTRTLALLTLSLIGAQVGAQDKLFGVGFVPHMQGGDEVEKRMHRTVGEMPEIDQMFSINDTEQFLELLVKLKKQGKKLDFLVLAGHGSKSAPYIGWSKSEMLPNEINVNYRREEVADLKKKLSNKRLPSGRRAAIEAELRAEQRAVQCLEEIPGLMNPGAVLLLLNCSTAGSDDGRRFVQDLGVLLLGADGGQTIASTGDVEFLEVEDLWDQAAHYFKNGGLKAWGDSFVDASWVTHEIKRGRNKAKVAPADKPQTQKKPDVKATGATYTGEWDSSYGKLKLTQSGKSVSGSSDYYSTKVEGTIEDDGKLHFKWSDSNGKKGVGVFELSSDGKSFSGSWNYILSDGKTLGLGGGWRGTRIGS